MSAFVAYLTEDAFYIASDTLVYTDKTGLIKEQSYRSKIDFYPTYRACVIGFGYARLSQDFFLFQKRLIVKDIEKAVELTAENFLQFLDLSNYGPVESVGEEMIGNLEIFGYSNIENKLLYYTILVNRTGIVVHQRNYETGVALVMHPEIDKNTKKDLLERNENAPLLTNLIEIMKAQYNESLKTETFKVALGGEMVLAIMQKAPSFSCHFSIPYQFDNYQQAFDKMVAACK